MLLETMLFISFPLGFSILLATPDFPFENITIPQRHCWWTLWSDWSNCDGTCGTSGIQRRNRTCVPKLCPDCSHSHNEEYVPCFVTCCEAPMWTKWSQWTDCSVTCGKGERTRKRTCVIGRCTVGSKCWGRKMEKQRCTAKCEKCEAPLWAKWGKWSPCSFTCGKGEQTRKRICKIGKCTAGTKCKGKEQGKKMCTTKCKKCEGPLWEKWGQWSKCSVTCGKGKQTRKRTCRIGKCTVGTECKGKELGMKMCTAKCEKCEEPKLGEWTLWSECPADCQGNTTRTRTCKSKGCQKECTVENITELMSCGETQDCKDD